MESAWYKFHLYEFQFAGPSELSLVYLHVGVRILEATVRRGSTILGQDLVYFHQFDKDVFK